MGTDANLNLVDDGEMTRMMASEVERWRRHAMELHAVRDVLRQYRYDHSSPAATIATIIEELDAERRRTGSQRPTYHCDKAHHLASDAGATPLATRHLRCAGCGSVYARCEACQRTDRAEDSMRTHLAASHCLSRRQRDHGEGASDSPPTSPRGER